MNHIDWSIQVCQTIDALHAMPPEDRAIVRAWLTEYPPSDTENTF